VYWDFIDVVLFFLYIFFGSVLIFNIIELVPYDFAARSHLIVTFALALSSFIVIFLIWVVKYGINIFYLILPPSSSVTPRELLWCLGFVIFSLMTGSAFMGYMFPWEHINFWGSTVITNLFSDPPLTALQNSKLLPILYPNGIYEDLYKSTFLISINFLIICLIRLGLNHVIRGYSFEFDKVYWDFIDKVLFSILFVTIYWWGS